jgi:hypothetical protein
MMAAFVSDALLAFSSRWYAMLFLIQVLFYSVALGGLFWKPLLRLPIIKLSSFFLLVNASIVRPGRYWSGERLIIGTVEGSFDKKPRSSMGGGGVAHSLGFASFEASRGPGLPPGAFDDLVGATLNRDVFFAPLRHADPLVIRAV